MASLEELAIQLLVVAIGALVGSTFMWLVIGPVVASRGMRKFMAEAWDLSDEDLSDPKKMMKAITREQGKTFAQSLHGAVGNIVQGMDGEKIGELAKQYGIDLGNPSNVGNLANGLNLLQGNGGGNNAFGGIAQMLMALQMMGGAASGGQGGAGIGWTSGGGANPFLHELGGR